LADDVVDVREERVRSV